MTDHYLNDLRLSLPLRESVIRDVIRTLNLPAGSRGLDVGCGIGYLTLWLAEAAGSDGHVTGIDTAADFVDYAGKMARQSGVAPQVHFQTGSANHIPFDDHAFDWAWSVDCVGYAPQVGFSAIRELERVVKPGGIVAVLFWSSQQLLPGYPELEARLNATPQGIAPFNRGSKPESHPLRTIRRFREAGLHNVRARTFTGDVCAPLSGGIREALVSLIRMRWGDPVSVLDRNDRALFDRICNPESPDFIVDSADYYAFFTYSLFYGEVS